MQDKEVRRGDSVLGVPLKQFTSSWSKIELSGTQQDKLDKQKERRVHFAEETAHRIQTGENPYVKEATAKQQSRKRKADNCAKEGAERRLAFQREKSVYPMQSRGRKLPSDWMTGIASQCKPETDIEMANIILVNNLEVCDTWLPSVSKVMANSDCFTRP